MARRRAYRPLNVLLNGRLVGTLDRQPTGAVGFRYAPEWLQWDSTFPISLSLPLRDDRYVGAPVINVFDNLLPDYDAMRRRIAERVGAPGTDAFSLLGALGRDCVGALQFLPEGEDPGVIGAIEGTPLSLAEVSDILENLALVPLGIRDRSDFRISIAGAQEKTALLRRDGRWFKPTGTTATTHILKPQIGRLPNGTELAQSVENEYFCLKLMKALDVPAADADIVAFGRRKVLVVERFDRVWTSDGRLLRRPQEDFCQALSVPSATKYQSEGGPGMRDIIGLLKGSDTPDIAVATFFRANLVFWLIGATDGHAKNFSLFIAPGGRFQMTPVYDVLSAQPSVDGGLIPRKSFKLAMSVGTNRHYNVSDIVPRHFLQTAALAGMSLETARAILADLGRSAEAKVTKLIEALPQKLPEAVVDPIVAALSKRSRLLADFAA